MPAANPSEPPGTASQASARAIASSDNSPTASVIQAPCFALQQHDLGDADAGSDLARQRQIERPARPAARQAIEHGQRQRPPRRKAPDPARPAARSQASCRGGPRPRCGRAAAQCRERELRRARANAVTAASVRPTPVPPTIRSRSQAPSSSAVRDRCGIAPCGSERNDIGAGAARALGDQIRRHRAAGNIDDAQPRPAHAQSRLVRRRARSGDRAAARAARPRRRRLPAAISRAGAPHPLPRNRLRQHLRHRAGHVDGIGIEHAVATIRHRRRRPRPRPAAPSTATANRRTRRRDRVRATHSRRLRRCRAADSASSGGISAAMQRSASASGSSTGATGSTPFSRAASAASSGVSEAGRRWGEVDRGLTPMP